MFSPWLARLLGLARALEEAVGRVGEVLSHGGESAGGGDTGLRSQKGEEERVVELGELRV
jgi:hypothetical protein